MRTYVGRFSCRDLLYPINNPQHPLCLDVASFYSFFNSPYIPHREGHAVDVYFLSNEALLPFDEVRVLEVKRVDTPVHRRDALNQDYLMILSLNSMYVVKTLHVEPRVKPGEKLVYGDPLGRLIISGYFLPWTEPHMHLEVRFTHDRYRARGGVKLAIARHRFIPTQNARGLEGVVSEVNNNYILLKSYKTVGEGLTPLAFNIKDSVVYVEGGYPHYGYVGVLGTRNVLGGERVGMYEVSIVENQNITTHKLLEKQGFKGIGTYVGREEIKLILRNNTPTSRVKEGDVVVIGDLSTLINVGHKVGRAE